MEEKRTSGAWIVVALLLLLLLPVGAYVVGYFVLCKVEVTTPAGYGRLYSQQWQVIIFEPAAEVDSMIREAPVILETMPEDGSMPY